MGYLKSGIYRPDFFSNCLLSRDFFFFRENKKKKKQKLHF